MVKIGSPCKVTNCIEFATTKGLCNAHYIRLQRTGTVGPAEVRPAKRSRLAEHPMYSLWRNAMRYGKGAQICAAWRDFECFIRDVGEIPEPNAQFRRICFNKPFEPGNVYWRKPEHDFQTLAGRATAMREWRRSNPDKARNSDLKKLYGITLDEYNALLEKQSGVCAICRQSETMQIKGKTVKLAVDHCHGSGTVRGLLCTACNRAIGLLKHDKEILQAAIHYLKT